MDNVLKKTYGVEGLVDWVANLRAGKATLVVSFTGGGMTSFGITPAEYTTENILYQHIIENSTEFKKGKIKLLRGVPVERPITMVTDLEEVKKTIPPKMEEIVEVRNCADATKWLKQNKDINVIGKSKAEIIDIAASNGVLFPNLVIKK